MKSESAGRALRSAVVLCLAALFFLLAMGVTLLGSGVYRSVAAGAQANYTHRTALSYVANQIRRGDTGGVAVGVFGDSAALRLTEYGGDGAAYTTLIYCYDGQLMELYTEAGTGLGPADGVALMPLAGLDFTLDGGLITATATDGVQRWSVSLSPRSGVEEVGAL